MTVINKCLAGFNKCLAGLALAGALIGGSSAVAANEVPAAMRGIWASPSCMTPDSVTVYSLKGYLYVTEDWISAGDLTRVEPRGDLVQTFESDEDWIFGRVMENGRLEEFYPPDDQVGLSEETLPDDSWQRYESERCGDAPTKFALLHGEGMAFLAFLGTRGQACEKELPTQCIEALFDFADVSKNNSLSIAELSRVVRLLTYIGSVSDDQGVSPDDVAEAMGGALLVGPFAAKLLTSTMDYDDDDQLTLAEILQDREALGRIGDMQMLLGRADMAEAMQAIKDLEALLEALPK